MTEFWTAVAASFAIGFSLANSVWWWLAIRHERTCHECRDRP